MSNEVLDEQLIHSRMRFMEDAFEGGTERLYRKRQRLPSFGIRAMSRWVFSKTKLVGHKSLDFIKNRLGRDRITFAANHTSDVDHAGLEFALIENGYQDLADRLVFPAGLKMWDRPQTRWAMGGMSTLAVATPGYFEDAQAMLRMPLTVKDRKLVEQYQLTMKKLNAKSLRAVHNDWEEGKAVIVVYPETTRSRNGLLQGGRTEMDAYFRRGWVLPTMIQGPYEAFPPEQTLRLGAILTRNSQVTVGVGEPIDARRLLTPEVSKWLQSHQANRVDFVMSRIAVQNPDLVDPKCRLLYERLSENVPEGLLEK